MTFSGRVTATLKKGMKVKIKPSLFEGKIHKGKEFLVSGEVRELCGSEVVELRNEDGTRFSPAYDISMLEITDLG